jgi:anti-sigma B factor antagonist
MIPSRVVMRVRASGEGIATIDISGEIDSFAEDELVLAYEEATAMGGRAIILNFEQVSQIKSSGVALLITLVARANRDGYQVLACGLTAYYERVFALTRLGASIVVYKDEASALSAFLAGDPLTPDVPDRGEHRPTLGLQGG